MIAYNGREAVSQMTVLSADECDSHTQPGHGHIAAHRRTPQYSPDT